MRIAVLGGSGHFGARIVRALHQEPALEVIVTGRSPARIPGAETVAHAALDLAAPDFAARLHALAPGLVIHCAGPFQRQDYRVAQAALAAGAHYVDLADGREFVASFAQALQEQAVQSRRAAITGASTLPALSWAVVTELARDLTQIQSIETVIAPGQRAPRGRATREAVFSYLGQPFPVWRDGKWQCAYGWMDLKRVKLDIGTRLAAACDVPDLTLLPRHFPGVQTIRFHAALEFGVQHLALWALAGLRRAGLPLPVARWAVALEPVAGLFDPFAGPQGGMAVTVVGTGGDGREVTRSWQLAAPARHGPEIPCMPAILLARRLARGEELQTGAYPCIGALKLSEFEPEFNKWGIVTRALEQPR